MGSLTLASTITANPSTTSSSSDVCGKCHGKGGYAVQNEQGYNLWHQCACETLRRINVRVDPRFRAESFSTFKPKNKQQEKAVAAMCEKPEGNYFLHGAYGIGKTHLTWSQFKALAFRDVRVAFRTARDLFRELQQEELGQLQGCSILHTIESTREPLHLFLDDIEKVRPTDFRREASFALIDGLYRKSHGLTITSNLSLKELNTREILSPASIRRIDDMCEVIEL